jgi:hypothetical protein
MTEEIVEYQRGELKFVRMRSSFEDLIGYVTYLDEYIYIDKPLRIEVETLFDEGRQVLSLQEYLPQTVVEIKGVEIEMSEVMFITPVKQEFIEQYEYVADFFYNNNSKVKKPTKKEVDAVEDVAEKVNKVVSIIDALAKKDKGPVH